MGKRSSMEKMPRDLYETTDPKALPPKFLEFIKGKTYAEPNCGSGQLINLIGDTARCMWASDIEPLAQSTSTEGLLGEFTRWDAMCLSKHELAGCDLIIGNPPYTKGVLLPMIDHFVSLKPTWLLLPADMAHNVYFSDYMKRCSRVVSVGRLFWFRSEWVTKTLAPDDPVLTKELAEKKWFWQRVFLMGDKPNSPLEYTGWWCPTRDKPTEHEFVRGTDNHCWYFWERGATEDTQTIFIGR